MPPKQPPVTLPEASLGLLNETDTVIPAWSLTLAWPPQEILDLAMTSSTAFSVTVQLWHPSWGWAQGRISEVLLANLLIWMGEEIEALKG